MNIDFSQIDDEGLEFMTADLLRCQGFAIESPPSRGPDRGKDLLAVRCVTDDMGITEIERYIVECKHFFVSGRSVRESDIGNFETKMKQHSANRYLLVTTSTVSETVKNQLMAVSKDESSPRKATYWAKPDLIAKLQGNPDIYRKYFHSWQTEADEAVDYVRKHLFSAHRGALLWCPGITAIFGNDGYEDARTQLEVENLRSELTNRKLEEVAFTTDDENFSWVVLVRANNAYELNDLAWECSWASHDSLQRSEGFTRLYSYLNTPHKSKCPMQTKAI